MCTVTLDRWPDLSGTACGTAIGHCTQPLAIEQAKKRGFGEIFGAKKRLRHSRSEAVTPKNIRTVYRKVCCTRPLKEAHTFPRLSEKPYSFTRVAVTLPSSHSHSSLSPPHPTPPNVTHRQSVAACASAGPCPRLVGGMRTARPWRNFPSRRRPTSSRPNCRP